MAVDTYVKGVFDMAARAVAGRDALKDAVRLGDTAQYHRTVRTTPEVKLTTPLLGVRRRLSALALARRRATLAAADGNAVNAVQQQFVADDITKAMSAMSLGTLMWANEQMGRPAPPLELAMLDGTATPTGEQGNEAGSDISTSEGEVNSGEGT